MGWNKETQHQCEMAISSGEPYGNILQCPETAVEYIDGHWACEEHSKRVKDKGHNGE